jgi:hypothetical protein
MPGTNMAFAPGITRRESRASMLVRMWFADMPRVVMVMRSVLVRMLVVVAVWSLPVVVGMFVLVDMVVGVGVRVLVAVLAHAGMFELVFVAVLVAMLMAVFMIAFHGNLLFCPDIIHFPIPPRRHLLFPYHTGNA